MADMNVGELWKLKACHNYEDVVCITYISNAKGYVEFESLENNIEGWASYQDFVDMHEKIS